MICARERERERKRYIKHRQKEGQKEQDRKIGLISIIILTTDRGEFKDYLI